MKEIESYTIIPVEDVWEYSRRGFTLVGGPVAEECRYGISYFQAMVKYKEEEYSDD